MYWIGLTGGIACGKSTVAAYIAGLGVPVLDADLLARQALSPGSDGFKQVVADFGKGVLLSNGEVDRSRLAEVVFSDQKKLQKLEEIIHPIVRKLANEWKTARQKSGEKVAVYDVPLLFEKNLQDQFDAIIVVGATPAIQLERLMKRSKLDPTEARKRIDSQMPMANKKKLADWFIENSGTQLELEKKVEDLWRELRRKLKSKT